MTDLSGRAAARAARAARAAQAGRPAPEPRGSQASPPGSPVLEIRDFSVAYRTPTKEVRAVDHVSIDLRAGEVVGLVGESGSGKSTLAYGAGRLLRPPALITSGQVRYCGRRTVSPADILRMTAEELQRLRWREIAIVFQSAMNALNPVLSGGMRQRVMIAMALATEPEIVIMDEPTTALDVVVQRDILGQIAELRERLGFSILFITHDLSLLLEIADRIAVMYAGQMLEVGSAGVIQHGPAHPYTKGLLSSFPSLRGPRRELAGIPGSPPDLRHPPPGCPFLPRCGYGTDDCAKVPRTLAPVTGSVPGAGHVTACPFVGPGSPAMPVSAGTEEVAP